MDSSTGDTFGAVEEHKALIATALLTVGLGTAGAAAIAVAAGQTKWGNAVIIVLFSLSGLLAFCSVLLLRFGQGTMHDPVSPPAEAKRSVVYSDGDEAYAAAIQMVAQARKPRGSEPVIFVMSLHGHAGDAALFPPRAAAPGSLELIEAINRRMAEGWTLRRLVNLTSHERLDWELEKLSAYGEEPMRYELKVLVAEIPAMLTPLVVGEDNVMLAVEDDLQFGVRGGIRIRGTSEVKLIRRYIDLLWDDRRAILLRQKAGVIDAAIGELRDQIDALLTQRL